ncbi:MAG: protein phosphatase 2C domain-containing protein [Anaerolineae bacterium]|nr:protein phosphatase 2C domain-containing protein [Anaerolineae bacterium]
MGEVPVTVQSECEALPIGYAIGEGVAITEVLETLPGQVRQYLARRVEGSPTLRVRAALPNTAAALAMRREHDILCALTAAGFEATSEWTETATHVFLLSKALAGAPLSVAWRDTAISETQRLDWLIQLCDALAELHAQDIVYLAVHPESLRVVDGRLVLADFSCARQLPLAADARLAGSEYYSAPEVFLAPQEISPSADIYGFGATWYALLLDAPLGYAHFESPFFIKPPLDFLPELAPGVNRIIYKALQRFPEQRHKSAWYLRDALVELQTQFEAHVYEGVGVCSDTGMVRDVNEDTHLVEVYTLGEGDKALRCGFYLISDGMGGEAGGVIASRLTAQEIAAASLPALKAYTVQEAEQDISEQLLPLLQEAINRASASVYQRTCEEPRLRRMGATVVVAALLGPQLYVANVGDSRAYLINQKGSVMLTQDHTVVAELVARGELDARDVREYPARGQLTRNIGGRPNAEAHSCHCVLNPGDSILLCCDGLTDVLDDGEIARIVLEVVGRQEACRQLVNLANGRGSPDNISVILSGLD